jgi:c-di-GMP-binding flagellar brake protein YcgR
MVSGKPLPLDENQKLLIRYSVAGEQAIIAAYPDDVVKDGIRRYWKIRRVTEHRQFFQRADERLKVSLHLTYLQHTWPMNADGVIEPEDGLTLDISNGGIAMYLDRRFEVGEVCEVTFPRVGTSVEGQQVSNVVSVVCWQRDAPKGSPHRRICGMQFRFGNGSDREQMQKYVGNIKEKFAL